MADWEMRYIDIYSKEIVEIGIITQCGSQRHKNKIAMKNRIDFN